MAKPFTFGALALAALWLAAMYRSAHAGDVRAAVDTREAPSVAAPIAPVARVTAHDTTSARTARPAPQPASVNPTPIASAPDEQALAPQHVANAEVTREQRWQRVEQVFASEAPDPSWHPEAEFRALFARVLPAGSALRTIDCKDSLCRVEMSHPDAQGRFASLNALALPDPTRPQAFAAALFGESAPSPDGRGVHSVVYLLRSGRDFPSLAAPVHE